MTIPLINNLEMTPDNGLLTHQQQQHLTNGALPAPAPPVFNACSSDLLQVPSPSTCQVIPKTEKTMNLYPTGVAAVAAAAAAVASNPMGPGPNNLADYTYSHQQQQQQQESQPHQLESPVSNSSVALPSSFNNASSGSTNISQSSYEEFQKSQQEMAMVTQDKKQPGSAVATASYSLENINPALTSQGYQNTTANANGYPPQQGLPTAQHLYTQPAMRPPTADQSANLFASNDPSLVAMQSSMSKQEYAHNAPVRYVPEEGGRRNGGSMSAATTNTTTTTTVSSNGNSEVYIATPQLSSSSHSSRSGTAPGSTEAGTVSYYQDPTLQTAASLQAPYSNMIAHQYPHKPVGGAQGAVAGGPELNGSAAAAAAAAMAASQELVQLSQQTHSALGMNAVANNGWVGTGYYMPEMQNGGSSNGLSLGGEQHQYQHGHQHDPQQQVLTAQGVQHPQHHHHHPQQYHQMLSSSHQYFASYPNGATAIPPEYQMGQTLQLVNAGNGCVAGGAAAAAAPGSVVFASNGNGMSVSSAAAAAAASVAAAHIMPIQMGTWQPENRLPVKSLVIHEGVNLHEYLTEFLVCPDKATELTMMSIASQKNKRLKTSKYADAGGSSSGTGVRAGAGLKNSKLREKYMSNNLNRLFIPAGIGGQEDACRQRHQEKNPVLISREQMVNEIMGAIEFALCSSKDLEQHRVGKGDVGINYAQLEVGRGIPMQLSLPEGVPVVMNASQKDEVENMFVSWKPLRTKPEHFFRMEDRHGQHFTLEELKEVVDILLSRPPRRINRYCARQLLTDVSYGQGRGVTEFNNTGQERSPHMMSYMTRREYNTIPVGAQPKDGVLNIPDEMREVLSQVDASLIPYQNTKKSNIYDPIWCRKTGVHKEGWCNHCKEGGWYLMKNSGFLYHKNHEHGIFPQGFVFEDPLVIRRKIIREARWEGQCGICYHWIDLDHTERKTWGTWYRHYKLCAAEYEEIKKLVKATGLPLDLVEVEYIPSA